MKCFHTTNTYTNTNHTGYHIPFSFIVDDDLKNETTYPTGLIYSITAPETLTTTDERIAYCKEQAAIAYPWTALVFSSLLIPDVTLSGGKVIENTIIGKLFGNVENYITATGSATLHGRSIYDGSVRIYYGTSNSNYAYQFSQSNYASPAFDTAQYPLYLNCPSSAMDSLRIPVYSSNVITTNADFTQEYSRYLQIGYDDAFRRLSITISATRSSWGSGYNFSISTFSSIEVEEDNLLSTITHDAIIPTTATADETIEIYETLEVQSDEQPQYFITASWSNNMELMECYPQGIVVERGDHFITFRNTAIESGTYQYYYYFRVYEGHAQISLTATLGEGATIPITNPVISETILVSEYDNPQGDIANDEENEGATDATHDWTDTTAPVVSPSTAWGTSPSIVNVYKVSNSKLSEIHGGIFAGTLPQQFSNWAQVATQCVVSCHILPFNISAQSDDVVKLAGQDVKHGDQSIEAPSVYNRFQTFSGGTITIPRFYDTSLDYTDTEINLTLPFIGTFNLNPAIVMGTTISITYTVDVITGDTVCEVRTSDGHTKTFNGNCAATIPITSVQRSQLLTGALMTVGGLASSFAGAWTQNPLMIAGGIGTAITGVGKMSERTATRSGNLSGSAALMSYRKAFVEIISPRLSFAAGGGDTQDSLIGGACNQVSKLYEYIGFTVCDEIHLENCCATEDEKKEIESLLREGIIL